MRTKFIELPSISELEEMLSKESKRDVFSKNIDTHFASLEVFIDFLNNLGLDTSNITLNTNWEKVRVASEDIFNKVIPIILNKSKEEMSILVKNLYSYLSEEDEPKKADLIITFGAKTKARVNKAIELYKKGLGKKLVFSGGSPLYSKNKPEAEIYRDIALEQGANPAVPTIFGIGSTATALVLVFKGRLFWTGMDTIIAILVVLCVLLWKTKGAKWAFVLSVLAAVIAGVPFIIMTWKTPACSPIIPNIGFLITNTLAFISVKGWRLEDRLYCGVNTVVCSLLVIPWFLQ